MKTPSDLSEAILRSGDTFATNATTCRRVASGIATVVASDDLGLTEKERMTLHKASELLAQIANTYAEAAQLKKRAEAARAKRQRDVGAALQGYVSALVSTADKVALIAAIKPYTFESGGFFSAEARDDRCDYLLGPFLLECLDDMAWGVAYSMAPSIKELDARAGRAAFLGSVPEEARAAAGVVRPCDRAHRSAGECGGGVMNKPLRPVTRETTALVRDRGMRPVNVTIASSSGVIELRAKGLRSRYTLSVGWCYAQAVLQHTQQLIAQRRLARRKAA